MRNDEAAQNGGVGQAVRDVSQHALALAKLEAQLVKLELAAKAHRYVPAGAFILAAIVLVLFAVGYGLAAAVEGLDAVLPRWAALLAVTGALAILAGVLAALARRSIAQASPLVPEQAIAEARETKRVLQASPR